MPIESGLRDTNWAFKELSSIREQLTKEAEPITSSGRAWEVLEELDKKIGEHAVVVKPKTKRLREQLFQVKRFMEENRSVFPQDSPRKLTSEQEAPAFQKVMGTFGQHVQDAVSKVKNRVVETFSFLPGGPDTGLSAPGRKILSAVVEKMGGAEEMVPMRDHAKEELVKTGFSVEASNRFGEMVPLLMKFYCQQLISYHGGSKEPPEFLKTMFQKSDSLWVLGNSGKYLLGLIGVEKKKSGEVSFSEGKVKNLTTFLEVNFLRMLTNLRKYHQEGKRLVLPENVRKELDVVLQKKQEKKEVSGQEMTNLGKHITDHLFGIVFPQGEHDIAIPQLPGLDSAAYKVMQTVVGEAISSGLAMMGRSDAPLVASSTSPQGEQELDTVVGSIFTKRDAERFVSLFGSSFLSILAVPGFKALMRETSGGEERPLQETASQFIGEALRPLIQDLLHPEDVAFGKERAVRGLQEVGVQESSIKALSTVASRLPQYLFEVLRVYDNQAIEPPGFLKPLFRGSKNESGLYVLQPDAVGKYHLSEAANALLMTFEGNTEGLSALFEANALSMLNNICQKLRAKKITLPKELLDSSILAEVRAQKIADFLVSTALGQSENLLLPESIASFQPMLFSLLKPFLAKRIGPLLPKIDGFSQQIQSEKPSQNTLPAPALLVPEFPQYAKFKPLADALGNSVLEAFPEFGPLMKGKEKDVTDPVEAPLFQLAGDITRFVVDGLCEESDFVAVKKVAIDQLMQLHFTEESIDSLTLVTRGLLEYLPLVLSAYEGETSDPPGFLSGYFVKGDGGKLRLNDKGRFIVTVLKDPSKTKGLTTLFEANVFTALNNVCQKIASGKLQIPKELLEKKAANRGKVLAEFIVKTSFQTSDGKCEENIHLPPIFKEIKPALFQMLTPILAVGIEKGVEKLDGAIEGMKTYAEHRVTAAKADKENITIPKRVQEACEHVVNLCALLGPELLSGVPELAPLNAAQKAFEAPPTTQAPLSQFAGEVVRVVGGGLAQHVRVEKTIDQEIGRLKEKLQSFHYSETTVNYPGRLISSFLDLLSKNLSDVKNNPQERPPAILAPFYIEQPPGSFSLNNKGQILLTTLSDENRKSFSSLLEVNFLRVLVNLCGTIDEKQKKDPDLLLNVFNETLVNTLSIIKSEKGKAGGKSVEARLSDLSPEVAKTLVSAFLPEGIDTLVLPSAFDALRPELNKLLGVMVGAGVRQGLESFDNKLLDIVSARIEPLMEAPTLTSTIPFTERIKKRLQKKGMPKTPYTKSKELRDNCASLIIELFPFLSPFKKFIGSKISKFFPYARHNFGELISCAIEESPTPEETCADLFKKPSAEQKQGEARIGPPKPLGANSPIELIKKQIKSVIKELRRERAEIKGVSLGKIGKRIKISFRLIVALFLCRFLPWFLERKERRHPGALGAPVEATVRKLVRAMIEARVGGPEGRREIGEGRPSALHHL